MGQNQKDGYLWGRKCTLIVSNDAGNGLDLSEFRIRFSISAASLETPNTLRARIYNLSRHTMNQIGKEFTNVALQAGYENGNFGIIFQGTIVQYWVGRERNVDSYLELVAADGDVFYNQAVLSVSLAAGSTPQQIGQQIFAKAQYSDGLNFAPDALGMVGDMPAPNLPRGKVLFGMARNYARDWARKYGYEWSIENGQVVLVPLTGYRPGEAVQLSSTSGMIGVPETTNDGVHVRALINPRIRIGGLVQVQPNDINTLTTKQFGPGYTQNAAAAVTTAQGYYRVLAADYDGDTRGQEWYVDLTCLAVDVTASPDSSVKLAG